MPFWRAASHPGRWLAAGLVGVLVVGVLIGEATGWPLLRGPLQRQASAAAHVAVELGGRFHLRLLGPPRLQVGLLTVGAAQDVPAPHLLRAEDALLAWRWGDLWRTWRHAAPLRIQTLTARQLDLRLLRLADGRATWALGAAAAGKVPKDQSAPLPVFDRLQVDAGHARVDDALLDTVLEIELAGGEGDASGRVAGYRAEVRGRWQALPLRLAVRTGGALPLLQAADSGAASPALPLRVEGTAGAARVHFDGHAAALLGARQLNGKLQISGPSLAAVGAPLGVTLPRTPAFQLEGQLAHDGGVWQLRADRAAIGSSRLAGDFRYDGNARPGRLSGRLTGSRLVLADLGPAIGAPGEGGSTVAARPSGRVLPQRRFDLPSLHAMNADVAVAIEMLDLGSQAIAPLQGVRTRVLLQDGVLQLQALQASVAGGKLAGSTGLDARREPARWDLDLQLSGIDMAGWVRALQSPQGKKAPPPGSKATLRRQRQAARQGGEQPVRSYLTGVLSGRLQVTGQGQSTAQLLATLRGSARLQLGEGTLSHLVTEAAGIDLAQALGVLVRGDQPLPLRCAVIELAVEQGVATVRRGVLDNADSTLRLDGRIDLRDEQLALRARMQPKDFSPLAPRVPLLVTGPLARPEMGLDGRALGARLAGAAALAVIAAPVAALLALVDTGKDPEDDPCAPAAQPPAAPRAAR